MVFFFVKKLSTFPFFLMVYLLYRKWGENYFQKCDEKQLEISVKTISDKASDSLSDEEVISYRLRIIFTNKYKDFLEDR